MSRRYYVSIISCMVFITALCVQLTVDSLFISSISASENGESSTKNQHLLFDYDVIIDAGHGGIDGGTSSGDTLEKQLNLAIGIKLYSLLKEQGYRVGITRLHDYALSDDDRFHRFKSRHKRDLHQRMLIAEGVQPRLFISIHINFSSHPYVHGPFVLHQDHAESALLADFMQQELNQLAGTNNRSKMSQYYYLLRNVTSPSLIVEVGYLSNPQEQNKLQDEHYQDRLAESILHSIEQYFTLVPL